MTPTFSLCHTTRRLENDEWRKAFDAWIDAAVNPDEIEYVLSADSPANWASTGIRGRDQDRFALNTGRHTAVDGWNCAAAASTGRFLITVADDWFPCDRWDERLHEVIPSFHGEYVVEVDTGGDHGLLTFSMLTRKYYERYGYIFHPKFIGMYADNWFTDVARRDGVVINARHLKFPHLHPDYGTAKDDSTYRWQHRPEAFEVGEAVYRQLRKEHFGEQYTNICPKSETAKFRHLTAPFCTGIGVDIGAGGDAVVPSAICVDLAKSNCPAMGSSPVHIPMDCRKLSAIFMDESLDYIYTSHLLEDFTWDEAQRLLGLWVDLLKPGGYLVILVPEGSLWRRAVENGHPPNFNHRHEFVRGELTQFICEYNAAHSVSASLRRPMQFDVVTESIPDPADYSILFVAKRKTDI